MGPSPSTSPNRSISDTVASHARERPDDVALRVGDGERLTWQRLDRRANRLARALVSARVRTGDHVGVLCCDAHVVDLLVAYVAAQRAGAAPAPLPVDGTPLGDAIRFVRPVVTLACAEGVDAWRTAGVAGHVFGDGPGVTWWKRIEGTHSPTAFVVPGGGGPVAEVVARLAGGAGAADGEWVVVELTHRDVRERSDALDLAAGPAVVEAPMSLAALVARLAAGVEQVLPVSRVEAP